MCLGHLGASDCIITVLQVPFPTPVPASSTGSVYLEELPQKILPHYKKISPIWLLLWWLHIVGGGVHRPQRVKILTLNPNVIWAKESKCSEPANPSHPHPPPPTPPHSATFCRGHLSRGSGVWLPRVAWGAWVQMGGPAVQGVLVNIA